MNIELAAKGRLPDRLMRGAVPIIDPCIMRDIKSLPFSDFFTDKDDKSMDIRIQSEFLEFMPQWIMSSKLNKVDGLERFPMRRLVSGITQAFDDFYIRYSNRTFKFLRGEYPYLSKYAHKWAFVEDEELTRKDVLVMSAPFSATGNMHPRFYETMERAEAIDIPVFVDCAFFGITQNLKLDLDYRCIQSVGFSTSKAFGAGCFRSGIEFSKQNGGPSSIQNEWIYVQLLSAKMGLEIAKRYSADYIPSKYRSLQVSLCKEYGLEPSDTVVFGLGDEVFRFFDVDGVSNRVCITPWIKAQIDKQA